jgi:serine/threonine-protein kinase RsbW
MEEGQPVTDTTEILVTIPAQSRFVALVRVTAASLAAELDFTVDEIADVRVGADELTSLLIEWAEDRGRATVTLRYVLSDNCLEMEGDAGPTEGQPGSEPVSPDSLGLDHITEQILATVVDSHVIGGGYGRIVKRRADR